MKNIIWISLLFLGACMTSGGKTPQEKRAAILAMRSEVLAELYKAQPKAKGEIASAPGYAVFSNGNINILFASFGGGYGVVSSKKGKKLVFMKMGEVGVGFGLGVKDFRAVFIFQNQDALTRFIDTGWAFGGQADAAAKAGDKGGAMAGEAVFDGIKIYQFTKAGLALQATVKGTKYWKDEELN